MDSAERVRARLAEIKGRQDRWIPINGEPGLEATAAYLAKELILDDVSWLIGYIETGIRLGEA